MTREDAIKELKESLETLREYDIAHSSRLKQALEMAIRTLENHDTFMKYAYSYGKQDALSAVLDETIRKNSIWNSITNSEGKNLEEIILELPPANPQYTGNEFFNFDAPIVKKSMEQDAISRDAVFDAIEREDKWLLAAKGHNGLTEIAFSGLKARVDALPSVTQKSGKWDRLYNWLNDMRLGITPDETDDDIDERHCREAQTDILDEIMEWMIKAESEE